MSTKYFYTVPEVLRITGIGRTTLYAEISVDRLRAVKLGRAVRLTRGRNDLFGNIRLLRNWGRIGTNRQELVEVFATERGAGEAREALARAKRRRGYRDL